jgi:hypothetical protein
VNVEDLLTRTAHQLTSVAEPPRPPDPHELASRALAVRRRRRIGGAVTAVVTVVAAAAVLVPAVLGRPDADAPPVDRLPDPLPDAPAWVDVDGDLHVGEHELDLPVADLPGDPFVRFALTRTGVAWQDGSATGLSWQPLDGPAIELSAAPVAFFTADRLGDRVVWLTRDEMLVTYDVGERREVGRISEPRLAEAHVIGTALPVLHVDDQHVVYEVGDAVWSLDLQAFTRTRLDISAAELLDLDSSVTVVGASPVRDRRGGPDSLAQLEMRTDDGRVLAEQSRLFREGRLSPGGRWYVTSTGYESGLRTVVVDTRTGATVPLDLPERMRGAYNDPWSWSGPATLVVSLYGPDRRHENLWTCRVDLGSCQALPEDAQVYSLGW